MRRTRLLCIILTVLLLAALLVLPAGGVSDLSFIAVNDVIPLTLSGDELPFHSGGVLYVPYTVFNQSSLGFYPSYNTSEKTLTLFSRSSRLVFDLAAGMVTDENKITQAVEPVIRSGVVFLPAVFCANHFGVQVSELTSRSGYPIIRFTTGTQVYDDSLFVEKAENLVSYRVSQYLASLSPAPAEPDPPLPPGSPEEPSDEPPAQAEEQEPARICLAVTGGGDLDAALDQLAVARIHAAFFLTADEILAQESTVRRMISEGHAVGLAVSEGEDAAVSLRRANSALDQVLKYKTLLAAVPESVDASAVSSQYCVFIQPSVQQSAAQAAQAHGESRLLFCSAGQLAELLPALQEAGVVFSLLSESGV